jgi:hypothetical protein
MRIYTDRYEKKVNHKATIEKCESFWGSRGGQT